MLDIMRRFRSSATAMFIVWALAASFVIGFIVLPSVTSDPTQNATVVARIDDEPVYARELDEAVNNMIERYRRQMGAQFDEKMLEQLPMRQIALQNIVNRRVMLKEADRAGLRVSDQALRDYIASQTVFQTNGQFDPRAYEQAIRGAGQGLTPAKYEKELRDSMTLERLQTMMDRSILVTEDQLKEIYIAESEKVNLAYVAVKAADVRDDVRLSEQDITAYYEANADQWSLPEQRQFRFVEISALTLAPRQKVTEEEAKAEYEKRKAEFSQDGEVRASHILFKVTGDDAEWEAARVKAAEAAAKARAGADFADLARSLSDDGSAANGGDLGFFGRDRMVKPFEEAAFATPKGEITDPVRTTYGWHVIKVTDRREPGAQPFAEVRGKLERELRTRKAQEEAKKVEAEVAQLVSEGANVESIAAKIGLPAQTTPFVSADGTFPGVLNGKPLLEAGFQLDKGKTSALIDATVSKAVIETVAVQAPRQRTLNEVRSQVVEALRGERAVAVAASRAAEILEAARKAGSLEKAARGFKVQETGLFSQREPEAPGIGKERDLLAVAFQLNAKNRFPDRIFQVGDAYYVISAKERVHTDLSGFEGARETLREALLEQKREKVFSDWMQAARNRVKVWMAPEAAPQAGIAPGVPGGIVPQGQGG